jgi:hypothetical protein
MKSGQESRLEDLSAQFELEHVKPRRGRTLIVGSRLYAGKHDRRLRYPDAVGVDMQSGDGVDVVADLEAELPESLGLFAHVECISVLEHSRRPSRLAENLQRLMAPRATIHLSVPFVWRYHAYPMDYWRFTADGVRELFPAIDWACLMYASETLSESRKLKGVNIAEHPFMPRCEVMGFGVKAPE